MTEARILERTYRDRLTAVRNITSQDENGETVWNPETLYENVPCALSKSSSNTPEKTDVRRTVENEMMIFASLDVMLQDMDRVTVVNEAGQTFSGIAGRTVVYAGSHGETPVKIEGIA